MSNEHDWAAILRRVHQAGNDFDVVTPAEASSIWRSADDLAWLVEGLTLQAVKGQRCSVCLMTAEQSRAAGYDCIMEC